MSLTKAISESNSYYIQDSRSYVGNCMMFHALEWNGYTCDLTRALVVTKEVALQTMLHRPTDIPWPKEYIDEMARPMVDHQGPSRHRQAIMDNAGITLPKPKKERTKKHLGRCDECGSYMSLEQTMKTGCPRCGA